MNEAASLGVRSADVSETRCLSGRTGCAGFADKGGDVAEPDPAAEECLDSNFVGSIEDRPGGTTASDGLPCEANQRKGIVVDWLKVQL